MPDALDLEELERLHEVATRAPWFAEYEAGTGVMVVGAGDFDGLYDRIADAPLSMCLDAEFIAKLRNAWPVLYDRIRTAEAERDSLQAAIGEPLSTAELVALVEERRQTHPREPSTTESACDAALRDAAALRQALAACVAALEDSVPAVHSVSLWQERRDARDAARALLATGADPTDGAE